MNLISREELKQKLDREDKFKLINALLYCSIHIVKLANVFNEYLTPALLE
jgi:hypothetical protein